MLLHNTHKKFQLGGALNQAQNTAAPIDIRWKQFDISGEKVAPLTVPKDMYGATEGGGSSSATGLPSDVEYVNSKLDAIRQKMNTKLTGPGSKDYSNSAEFKADSDEITKWARAKSMLKSREDDFKTTKTKLVKATDDFAMYGGKALVKDNSTGSYIITDSDSVLTDRIRTDDGLTNKYTPVTVGDALALRFSSPEFSGFNSEKGQILDKILENVVDSESVQKEMNTLFDKAGTINESNSTFVSSKTGSPHSISDLLNNLSEAEQTFSQNKSLSTKSNASTLAEAVSLFRDNMNPSHYDALRNKQVAKFVRLHGNQIASADDANTWVDNQVNAEIANSAKVFLTTSLAKKTGSTVSDGKGGTEKDLSKQNIWTNKVTLARMEAGDRIKIESSYDDAEDLQDQFNVMGDIYASELPIKEAVIAGAGTKGTAITLKDNTFISKLAGDNLQNNLFLADSQSTPVNELNHGNGLSTAIVNTSTRGGTMKILKSMPYIIDQSTGQRKIAWKRVGDAIKYGKEVKKLTDQKLKDLGLNPETSRLSDDDRESILKQATLNTKFDPVEEKVMIGDIAMIPILVNEPRRGFHDKLENVLSSKTSSEETAMLSDISSVWDRNVYKTYAFTVLSDKPAEALDPNAYGPAMKLEKETPVGYLLGILAKNNTLSRTGFNFTNTAFNASQVSPTIQ